MPDRYWLITWTCYGHWLPGDERGFVGNIRDTDGTQVVHNIPGKPYDRKMPRLEAWVRRQMRGEPVMLGPADAQALIAQYQQTATIRRWELPAASVMFNHTHVVVGVPGDPNPDSVLETLKSWATRALQQHRAVPPNGTFWTAKGSTRKLPDHAALQAGVVYVARKQPNPLAVWWDSRWNQVLEAWDAERGRKEPGR